MYDEQLTTQYLSTHNQISQDYYTVVLTSSLTSSLTEESKKGS